MANKRGRPTLLSDELIEEAYRLSKECFFLDTVAAMLGVASGTAHGWLRRGRRALREPQKHATAADRMCVRFYEAVKKGRAEAELAGLRVLRQAAGRGAWQAACWLLERSLPEKYSTNRLEINQLKKEVRQIEKQLSAFPTADDEC